MFKKKNKEMNFLLLSVPFLPSQPIESLKIGDIYLKSIDKNHRRYYEKFSANQHPKIDLEQIQQVYVNPLG